MNAPSAHQTSSAAEGPRIWLVGATALGLFAALCLIAWPGIEGWRALIRATARSSLFFFLLAYTAQAAYLTCPGRVTSWLRRHRRQWGWLLVTSHAIHAVAIVQLMTLDPALFDTLSPPGSRIGPGLAYVVLVAMGLTSFDLTAALIGRKAWAALHTWGSHYLWFSFLVGFGKRVPMHPIYALPCLLLIAALLWRLWATRLRVAPAISGPT